MSFVILHKAEQLDQAMQWLQSLLEDERVSATIIHDLKVVLDELIANTFMHGCGEQQDGWLKVSLEHRDNYLSLIFEDKGEPFDPLQQESAEITGSLADRPNGGLGLLLVKSLTDVQQYHRAEDRNILVLGKNLN